MRSDPDTDRAHAASTNIRGRRLSLCDEHVSRVTSSRDSCVQTVTLAHTLKVTIRLEEAPVLVSG